LNHPDIKVRLKAAALFLRHNSAAGKRGCGRTGPLRFDAVTLLEPGEVAGPASSSS
jgi:hypothetical protein